MRKRIYIAYTGGTIGMRPTAAGYAPAPGYLAAQLAAPEMTTCLAVVLVSLLKPPTAGFLGAIRFGSRPHPLRQENQPIPLNDVLSSPVGESR